MNDEKSSHSRSERGDAAENRQRILNVALKLFEQNGVEQVSMNRIGKEAVVSPATLYRRYSNKGELCLDLIKDDIGIFLKEIEVYLENKDNEPLSKRFKRILSMFIQFKEDKAQLLKEIEKSATKNKSMVTIYNKLHQIFIDLFEEMSGKEPLIYNGAFRADMLLSALSCDSYLFQREVRGYSPEMILEQVYLTFFSIKLIELDRIQ